MPPRTCIRGPRGCSDGGIALPGGSRCRAHGGNTGWQRYKATHPARAAFYASQEWRTTRQRHLEANPTCVRCGEPATDVDHVTAVALGGDVRGELQSMCRRDHHDKTVRDSHEAAKRAAARRRGER